MSTKFSKDARLLFSTTTTFEQRLGYRHASSRQILLSPAKFRQHLPELGNWP